MFLGRSCQVLALARTSLLSVQQTNTLTPPRWEVRTHSTTSTSNSALNLTDTKVAFEGVSNVALWRALAVFRICSSQMLVSRSAELLNISTRVLGENFTMSLLRKTFFGHFCAGETADEVEVRMRQLKAKNVGSILDYAAEADVDELEKSSGQDDSIVVRDEERVGVVSARTYDYLGEAKCDANVQIFLDCIDAAARQPDGFTAVKLTALGKPEFLERISKILVGIRKTFEQFLPENNESIGFEQFREGLLKLGITFSEDEIGALFEQLDKDKNQHIDYLEWTSALNLDNLTERKLFFGGTAESPLKILTASGRLPLINEEDAELVQNLRNRLQRIAEAAASKQVKLMIDAEQSYLQPAIEHFTLNLQRVYNAKQPIVFNTFQAYLRHTRVALAQDLERAKREGWWFACKLVRGAYMVLERQVAQEKGAISPVFDNKQQTDESYNQLIDLIIKNYDRSSLMVASHNQQSITKAVQLMQERGIPPGGRIYFAQLLGMSDILTFNLGLNGYHAYKYVPYGPIREVVPYLVRRAQENSEMLSFSRVERQLCWQELKRRRLFF